MRKLLLAVLVASLFVIGVAVALADPIGTGQPSQSCQSQTSEPGQAANAPGSAFNEPTTTPTATTSGGTAGGVYAGNGISATTAGSPNAVSQYDVACYQVSH